MSRDGPLVGKLKECLQEAVVFLRTLGDFRIPAVVERRRKELLEKLIDVQGDTLREKPPKFEESPEKEAPKPVVKKAETTKEKPSSSSESSSTVTSPSRRDSKVVNSLVSGFETIHKTAKKEEEEQTPKKWVELRKTKKPADFPTEGGDDSEAKEGDKKEDKEESKPVQVEDKPSLDESNELKPDPQGSTVSLDSTGSNEPEATPKQKKKNKLGVSGLFKKRGRDKSPGPSKKETPADQTPAEPVEGEAVESEAVDAVEVEEGVKMSGKLEHKTKTRLQTKYVVKDVKLKDTTLHIGDKETLSMLGCTLQSTDPGFELFSHSTQKQYTFRVTEGGEETKEKWITALKATIEEVTPKEEEESNSADTVPTIQVVESAPPKEPVSSPPTKRRESKNLEVKKPVKNLPAEDLIKGYVHRKKPGLGSRWEKTYCVVTYTAIYFTPAEGNSEYEYMFQVAAGEATFSEKAKGHDKNSRSMVIKTGRKTEQLSIDKKDFDKWWSVLQQAYGYGESLELNEEEEELIEEEPIDDDLYEEVSSAPPVPNSPRPGRTALPEVPPEDDFIIDEDIYEDTDDILPPMGAPTEYQTPVISAAPKLPDRNPSPQPKLPPRNPIAPPAQPKLPPRNTGPPLPSRGELPKHSPPIPTMSSMDEQEDVYDDVVVPETEETYDDVVVGEEDDTYDDVVAGKEPITEEYYEDMAPGEIPQEDYVVMERGGDEVDDDDGELYVDVDHEPAPAPAIVEPTPKAPSPTSKPKGTFSRVFAGKKSAAAQVVHSGQVSYRAPKKTKFEDKYATVEDTSLLVYKSSSDKKHQEKIALTECGMELGSTEAGAGQFAFRVTKSGKVHHFSLKSQSEMDGWVDVLKTLVKYAPVSLGEQQVFQTTQDHIAESDDQLTFKKGSFIRLINKESDNIWFGQLGNEAQVFNGKTGKFPADKVVLADDLYI